MYFAVTTLVCLLLYFALWLTFYVCDFTLHCDYLGVFVTLPYTKITLHCLTLPCTVTSLVCMWLYLAVTTLYCKWLYLDVTTLLCKWFYLSVTTLLCIMCKWLYLVVYVTLPCCDYLVVSVTLPCWDYGVPQPYPRIVAASGQHSHLTAE